MGSSASNLKGASFLHIRKVDSFSCSTVSSERTMVHPISGESKKSSIFNTKHRNKTSMLPNKNFFGNICRKSNTKEDNARFNPASPNSLSRRNNAKVNRKKVAAAITKSMIGKPTNFKHVNSSTTQFNQMRIVQDDNDEASRVAAQMAILSTMIKPLSSDESGGIPVIPIRSSSYGNDLYIKQFPIPETTIIATSSMRKNRKKVTGMKSGGGYVPGSITKRKYTQCHLKSIKKSH